MGHDMDGKRMFGGDGLKGIPSMAAAQ